ncbi:hypothetical protein HYV86_06025 [Candidatus Woesearchaeota archaeon]|nr:hypothetical protein [Candidatus Woesearchaeota archaeon]
MKTTQIIIGIIAVLSLFLVSCNSTKYDEFAQCLTDNKVVMYGAYWCGHCAEQKRMFSDSFEKVTYVECSLPDNAGQTQVCQMKNITGYPTWEFADGSRVSGKQEFETLSAKSGCLLPDGTLGTDQRPTVSQLPQEPIPMPDIAAQTE